MKKVTKLHNNLLQKVTLGSNFRLGVPVLPTSKTLEMALNPVYYSNVIVKKFNIHLKSSGKRIRVEFDPSLAPGQYGRAKKSNPYVIYVGRDAFLKRRTTC